MRYWFLQRKCNLAWIWWGFSSKSWHTQCFAWHRPTEAVPKKIDKKLFPNERHLFVRETFALHPRGRKPDPPNLMARTTHMQIFAFYRPKESRRANGMEKVRVNDMKKRRPGRDGGRHFFLWSTSQGLKCPVNSFDKRVFCWFQKVLSQRTQTQKTGMHPKSSSMLLILYLPKMSICLS